MDDCQRTADRLTPYVDDELPAAERNAVEGHLNRCPPCRRSADEEQGGRRLVRERAERLQHAPLPPGLRSRCEQLAAEHCRGRVWRPWPARLVPVALMAAVIIVAAVGVLSVVTRQSGTVLAAQLTADHVKCFKVFEPNAPAASAGAVEHDLESRYGWDMHVPPSSAEHGLQLLGGRRCLYAEGTMPHVMYRTAGAAPVSLFKLEGVVRDEADVRTMGHRCRIWSRGGSTYVLVTPDTPTVESARLVSYVRQEAR
jgi:anti-sigma factor RsiW